VAKKQKTHLVSFSHLELPISIVFYAFVNVAVTTGVLPTTGLPFPLLAMWNFAHTSLYQCWDMINIAFTNHMRQNRCVVYVPDQNPVERI